MDNNDKQFFTQEAKTVNQALINAAILIKATEQITLSLMCAAQDLKNGVSAVTDELNKWKI